MRSSNPTNDDERAAICLALDLYRDRPGYDPRVLALAEELLAPACVKWEEKRRVWAESDAAWLAAGETLEILTIDLDGALRTFGNTVGRRNVQPPGPVRELLSASSLSELGHGSREQGVVRVGNIVRQLPEAPGVTWDGAAGYTLTKVLGAAEIARTYREDTVQVRAAAVIERQVAEEELDRAVSKLAAAVRRERGDHAVWSVMPVFVRVVEAEC